VETMGFESSVHIGVSVVLSRQDIHSYRSIGEFTVDARIGLRDCRMDTILSSMDLTDKYITIKNTSPPKERPKSLGKQFRKLLSCKPQCYITIV